MDENTILYTYNSMIESQSQSRNTSFFKMRNLGKLQKNIVFLYRNGIVSKNKHVVKWEVFEKENRYPEIINRGIVWF